MKKSLFIITAVIAFTAASCQKVEDVQLNSNQNQILTVTADIAQFESDTKTSMDGTATTIRPVWSSGDEIKLFNTEGNSAVYVINSGVGTGSATFALKEGETALTGTLFGAYYPAANAKNIATSPWGNRIIVDIPSYQVFTPNGTDENAGTFESGLFPMIAKVDTFDSESTNLNLTFKNVLGLVQINLKDASAVVTQIDLFSHSLSIPLSGEAYASINVPGDLKFTHPSAFVTLTFPDPVVLNSSKSTSFYIAAPASTLSKVFVTTTTKIITKSTSATVVRSKIRNMPALTISSETEVIPYPEKPDVQPVVVGGVVWAPVNCGYDGESYPYGKLYQWGRKDGSGYGASWKSVTGETVSAEDQIQATTTGPIQESEESSSYFYSGSEDWLAVTNHKRWNSADSPNDALKEYFITPTKTINDPCPTGWRIPINAEISGLMQTKCAAKEFTAGDGTIAGYHFGKSPNLLFIPATGFRSFSDGNFWGRNVQGYYHAQTAKESGKVCGLAFNGSVIHSGNASRGYGYAIRCVLE